MRPDASENSEINPSTIATAPEVRVHPNSFSQAQSEPTSLD
jgi:hypothetical protein